MRFDGVCPGCMTEVETIAHVPWSCPVANDIWLQSRLTVHKWDPVVNFFDLMELVRSRLERNEVELFCCIAYFIWGQRNKWIHEGHWLNPIAVMQRASALLKDYAAANGRRECAVPEETVGDVGEVVGRRWYPPEEGRYKVNWETVMDLKTRHVFLGVVVGDHNQHVMAAMVMKLPMFPRGVHYHVGSVLHVLKFAMDMGFHDIIIEGPVASLFEDFSL